MLDLITHLFSPGFNAGSIPSLIDRGFYRQKYDAARALQTYSFTARREVELANLTANLVGLVNKTVQPKQFSIWIRPFYRKLTEEK